MKEIISDIGSVFGDVNAWDIMNSQVRDLHPSKVFVLTDTNTREHCAPYFQNKFKYEGTIEFLTIPAGEVHKNISTCTKVWDELSEKGADRQSLLINLGGGVITDLGGFIACTFRRGIEFIHIPTSLLAMVDASVGGKNGVDLGSLKNQIGVIKQPKMVLVDTDFLNTLPDEHMLSGTAEMLKHGLIQSQEYWDRVLAIDDSNLSMVSDVVWESIEIKNAVVKEDPLEKGIRKTLNYGHTLGHAIESYCLDSESKEHLLHGEAIAIGMILATFISSEMCGFPKKKLAEISQEIIKRFKKVVFTRNEINSIIDLLIFDKKNSNGIIYFVLLKNIGQHEINCVVPNDLIYKSFEYYENLNTTN